MPVTRTCKQCGEKYSTAPSRNRYYCSSQCWRQHHYETKTCPQCGEGFTHRKSQPKTYCSQSCFAQSGYRQREPDKWTATVCPECGKEFEYRKSWPRKYCSRECAGINSITNISSWEPTAYETICEQCGMPYTTTPAATRGRFCSHNCFGDWMRENAPAGEDHPKFGVKVGRSPHLPPPTTKECPICGEDFVIKPSHADRRVTCSMKCLSQYFIGRFTGENSGAWKGGYENYYGPNWRAQRRKARKRDGYRCRICGTTEKKHGREMDVHHIKPFRECRDYKHANRLNNLISLCVSCHKKAEHRNVGFQLPLSFDS